MRCHLPSAALDQGTVGRAHSADMVRRNFFAHASPDDQQVGDRLKVARVAFLTTGENLAFAPTLPIAHQGLMDSAGHRANILGTKWTHVASGVAQGTCTTSTGFVINNAYFVVQVFVQL